jgi:hypothetical protein
MSELSKRRRDACAKLRTTPVPLSDFIPLLQEAADALDAEPRPQWTVGQLIDALALERGDFPVYIETSEGDVGAGGIGSYRGYYEQLAIGLQAVPITADQLAQLLRKQVGDTVTGYKGGEYRITRETPVWAAEYGSCGDMIVGIDLRNERVTLMTEPDL